MPQLSLSFFTWAGEYLINLNIGIKVREVQTCN